MHNRAKYKNPRTVLSTSFWIVVLLVQMYSIAWDNIFNSSPFPEFYRKVCILYRVAGHFEHNKSTPRDLATDAYFTSSIFQQIVSGTYYNELRFNFTYFT